MTPRLDRERWRAVSPHLDRALELTGEERTAWLVSLRAEDASLAADVEALLEGHGALQQEGFLEGGPTLPSRQEATSSPTDLPDRIGPYLILREVGRGGMGRVYLAEQEGDGFRRQVALKVVAPGDAGVQVERRFRDERRILAGLEHPGIARFYDAGRAPDGTWFLALEYVEGSNLIEHAQQRDLPTDDRLRLFLPVLERSSSRTRARSSIATSSRATSWSGPTNGRACSTSALRSCSSPTPIYPRPRRAPSCAP